MFKKFKPYIEILNDFDSQLKKIYPVTHDVTRGVLSMRNQCWNFETPEFSDYTPKEILEKLVAYWDGRITIAKQDIASGLGVNIDLVSVEVARCGFEFTKKPNDFERFFSRVSFFIFVEGLVWNGPHEVELRSNEFLANKMNWIVS